MPLLGKHLYGVLAWDFSDRSVSDFQIMWNRCVRRMFQLPYATHINFLPFIMCISSATNQIYGRFLKLCHVMEHSENDSVNYLTYLCMSSARSIKGSTLRIVGKRLHVVGKRKLLDEDSQLLRQAYINESQGRGYFTTFLVASFST